MGTRLEFVALTSASVDEAATPRGDSSAPLPRFAVSKSADDHVDRRQRVSRVNRAAGVAAVPVGPDTLAVDEKSLWTARRRRRVRITFEAMHGL